MKENYISASIHSFISGRAKLIMEPAVRVGAVFCCLALGCAKRSVLPQMTDDSVVLCFGDSLTHGTGADYEESYPSVLAGLLGCETVNEGVPGEVSAEGLQRLPAVLIEHRPVLVVLCHGGNDLLRKVPDQEIERNLRRMIEISQDAGAAVLLLGVPRPGLLLRAQEFYANVAVECGAVYDKKTIPHVLSRGALKSDPIHPNARGYREIAERVAARIRKRR